MSITKTIHKGTAILSTERTSAESAEEKLNLLLDTVDDFLFFLDSNGCFESASYKGSVALGYLPHELRKKHITEIVIDRNKSLMINSIRQIITSQKQVSINLFLHSKTNDEIKHQVTLRPIKSANRLSGIFGLAKNLGKETALQEKITALKNSLVELNRLLGIEKQRSGRQKAILQELNRLKNDFISQFSHELRTPLSTIIGFSEAICSDDHLSEEMKNEFQREILNEAKRLAKAIDEALEATNLESGKGFLIKTELNIVDLVKNVIFSNKILAENKNIHLNYDLPSEKCLLKADKERITDVFDALIKNAIKYTQKSGNIRIFGQIFPHEIEFVFTDTGRGISQNDSKSLLNSSKSFQIISKAKSETGIGLDFAKKIVDLHDGFMEIQSEIDKGTAVIIKLPRNYTD